MSMRKTSLAPGQLLRSVHMEKTYLAGNPLLEVASVQRKTHVNSVLQVSDRAPRQSYNFPFLNVANCSHY